MRKLRIILPPKKLGESLSPTHLGGSDPPTLSVPRFISRQQKGHVTAASLLFKFIFITKTLLKNLKYSVQRFFIFNSRETITIVIMLNTHDNNICSVIC